MGGFNSQSRMVGCILVGWMSISSPVVMIILPMRCCEFSLTKPDKPVTEEQVVLRERERLQLIHLAKEEATNQPKNPGAIILFFGINFIIKELFRNTQPTYCPKQTPLAYFKPISSLLHLLIYKTQNVLLFLKMQQLKM